MRVKGVTIPMMITRLEKKLRSGFAVYIDDEYFETLDIDTLTQFQIKQGQNVDEAFLQQVQHHAQSRIANERALNLLAYRDHSAKELHDKLCQRVAPEIAQNTVDKMKGLALLDDVRYAQKLASYFLRHKYWSYRKSLFELKRKGLQQEIAEKALDDEDVRPEDQIFALLKRKYHRDLQDTTNPMANKKVYHALARLGFSYDDIRTAVSAYLEEQQADE